MSKKVYLGVDVGKLGAICGIDSEGEVTTNRIPLIKDIIDTRAMVEIFRIYTDVYGAENVFCGAEDVHSIFGVSAKSNFQFGKAAGLVEGFLVGLKIPFILVPPKTWQKHAFLGVPIINKPLEKGKKIPSPDTKAMALVAAKRLFPSADLVNGGPRATKPHDGIVDALLIANYIKANY